ncbi:hypothetical protein [Methylobacterium sp. A54F]
MVSDELSDWFVKAAHSAAKNLKLGSDLKNMPEGYWRRVVDAVDTRARMSEERIPIGWQEMLARKVGRTNA